MNQLFAEIARNARTETSQRLKYPLNIIWDEFGISPPVKNLNNALSASRSKGVRFTLVIQDFSQLSIQYNKNFSEMIKNNTMSVVYLLGGNVETLNEMSQRIGNQYRWNKEKSNFEVVPVITKDRLAHMSVGEGVVSSQRKNPYLTRYLPFNNYIFYKSMGEPEEPPVQQLAPLHSFSLIGSYEDMKAETEKAPVQEESVDGETAKEQTESIMSEDNTTPESEPTKAEKEAVTDVDFSDVI